MFRGFDIIAKDSTLFSLIVLFCFLPRFNEVLCDWKRGLIRWIKPSFADEEFIGLSCYLSNSIVDKITSIMVKEKYILEHDELEALLSYALILCFEEKEIRILAR